MTLKFRQFYKPAKKDQAKTSQNEESPVQQASPVSILRKEQATKEITERSFAVFAVGKEWFAVDLDSTLEILHTFEIVTVPHLPETFSGVTNLRGESVPIVDMQKLLRAEAETAATKTCLVMMLGATKIGFLIDSDVEIVSAVQGKLYPLPDCYSKDEAKFLEAIFWLSDRFVGILRPAQALEVLTSWELLAVSAPLDGNGKPEEEVKK